MTIETAPDEPPIPRKRRIVTVEFDVSRLTEVQVDAILLGALAISQDVSLKIEVKP